MNVPTPSQRTKPVDPQIYRDQIAATLSLADNPRNRKYRDEIKRRLSAIKATADAFAEHEDYPAAVTVYEVLVAEVLKHYNDYFDEYTAPAVETQHIYRHRGLSSSGGCRFRSCRPSMGCGLWDLF